MAEESRIAVFMDFENIALGVKEAKYRKFDIAAVLARLLEKGRIVVKRAYCDWNRYSDYTTSLHEHAVELINVPQRRVGGKNSADIRMVVDALDMCYSKEHVGMFVILSGDSDFSPLVAKLRENNKLVVGLGVKGSTSTLFADTCDEFIFYEDVVRPPASGESTLPTGLTEKQRECFQLVVEATNALIRENKEVLWGSMVKQTITRKRPYFNEGYYDYESFSELLEDAEQAGILELEQDDRSGGYIITDLTVRPKRSRRRRTRRSRKS